MIGIVVAFLALIISIVVLAYALYRQYYKRPNVNLWRNVGATYEAPELIPHDKRGFDRYRFGVSSRILFGTVGFGLFLFWISMIAPAWGYYVMVVEVMPIIAWLIMFLPLWFAITLLIGFIFAKNPFSKQIAKYVLFVGMVIFILDIWIPELVINIDGTINQAHAFRASSDYLFYWLLGDLVTLSNPILIWVLIYIAIPLFLISIILALFLKGRKTEVVGVESWVRE